MNAEDSFYSGICCALAVIHAYDQPTMLEAIVKTVKEDELIKHGRKFGVMRWSGLSQYLRDKRIRESFAEKG